MKQLICSLLVLCCYPLALATPVAIEDLFRRLERDNKVVHGAQLEVDFRQETLNGVRSRLFPSLGVTFAANEGEDGAIGQTADISGGGISPSGGLGGQSDGLSDIASGRGWVGQLSTGYFLFSKFAISDTIDRATSEVNIATIEQTTVRDEKRSQVIQLLLEWQALNEIQEPLTQASELIEKVKVFANGRSRMLYTRRDRATLQENSTSLEYNRVKVVEGQMLIESALVTLIPTLTESELASLPKIVVDFEIPSFKKMRDSYLRQSRNHKINILKLDSARGYLKTTSWDRPWIPTVYWSASYSKSGSYTGEESDAGASTSLLFSFNLFDGFYTSARREQAEIGVKAEKVKAKVEEDRRVLLLRHRRMKAVVAKAEYHHRKAKSVKKKLRYLDLKRKMKSGIGTKLELSLGTLAWVKAKMEALESLKDYQQAVLGVAVELDQWSEVKINEEAT